MRPDLGPPQVSCALHVKEHRGQFGCDVGMPRGPIRIDASDAVEADDCNILQFQHFYMVNEHVVCSRIDRNHLRSVWAEEGTSAATFLDGHWALEVLPAQGFLNDARSQNESVVKLHVGTQRAGDCARRRAIV